LKNVHLAISWLPTLEKELNTLKFHENFRLWLTSEPHTKFSSILLKSSLKVTFEAPPGIKKNLQRIYESWSPEYIAQGSPLRSQALFVLAWFHAIIQERRTFIPQGWSKFYEYGYGDLRASAELIDQICSANNASPEWITIHGLLENAIYGGRVDNDYDVRVLRAYLVLFFSNDVIGKEPKRFINKMKLPQTGDHKLFIDLINQLGDQDTPSLFFLPANIDRTVQRINSGKVISSLKVLNVTLEEGARFNREKWSSELAPLLSTWQKLTTTPSNLLEAKTVQKPNAVPTEVFVYMEHQKALNLVKTVNNSLQYITKVISGNALLTPQIAAIGNALLRGAVPDAWADIWEGPSDPYNWIGGLCSRAHALASWVDRANNGSLLQHPMDLSELFSPDTLLNALRQQTARITKVPVDRLKMISAPDMKLISSCKLPISVKGMLLQGCVFDGASKLQEVAPDGPTLAPLGNYCLGWVPADENDPYPAQNVVPTPIYYTSTREKYIGEVSLPCAGDRTKWVLAGVAICLCE
jgi:dynein heavy chain 2